MGGRGSNSGSGTATAKETSAVGSASGGGGVTVEGYGAAEQALAKKLFGRSVSAAELASLTGMPAGSIVEVSIVDGRLRLDVSHKYISEKDGMTRMIYRDGKGNLTMRNDVFFLATNKDGSRKAPTGFGANVFARQVVNAQKSGVSYISTFALRDDRGSVVGYKVWPRLGYDAKLPSGKTGTAIKRSWEGLNPLAKLSGTKAPSTVQQLYSTRGGRQIWEKHGSSEVMVFNLKRGSNSLNILGSYLRGRK